MTVDVSAVGVDQIEAIAQRALDRSGLRASLLVDRTFTIAWTSVSSERLLGHTRDAFVGTSVFDHLHADDLHAVAEILAFEQTIDVSIRNALTSRSVRDIRVRRADGDFVTLEASLSNFFDDPDIGMLLIDVQAPSQFRNVDRAIELTRVGADLRDTLAVVLTELTAADPGHTACAIVDPDGVVLAATPIAPSQVDDGLAEGFATSWTVDLREAGSAEPVGHLHVWTRLSRPHPLDVESSHRVAGHAAVVIGRHRAMQELQRAASHDALTGAVNRRALESELRTRSGRGDDLLIAYLDLNDFKGINDRIGHDAGDAVLTTIATRLRSSLRRGDLVARVGGDEFVVVFSAPTPDPDALRERLATIIAMPVPFGGELIGVTASIGISTGRADPKVLLRRADHEMLGHKRRLPSRG